MVDLCSENKKCSFGSGHFLLTVLVKRKNVFLFFNPGKIALLFVIHLHVFSFLRIALSPSSTSAVRVCGCITREWIKRNVKTLKGNTLLKN